MQRTVENKLLKWRDASDRKPLIIRGARQVGKTYSITKFGQQHFSKFVKIDFEKERSLRKIFAEDLLPETIIELIEIEKKNDITAGDTLLFFDEIQLCPRALMALRYFFEEFNQLHVIAAGSLLEFEIDKISFPVGRVEFMFMYPLSFDEFLMATDNKRLLTKRPTLNNNIALPIALHYKFLQLLKEYFFVGGMPEAIVAYTSTTINAVSKAHESLIISFVQDILKYEKNLDIELLRAVFEQIPALVGQQIKYSNILTDCTTYKIKQTLNVLMKCLLIHKVSNSPANGLPLLAGQKNNIFKYCFLDIGLMQSMCGISLREILQSNDLTACYQGALSEQYIGQELLISGGSQRDQLFYWRRAKRNSNAEIDYLMVEDGEIIPIEVKSGPAGKLKSLHLFINEHPATSHGIVLNSGNIGQQDKLHFFPLYTRLSQT
jgi:predicted AAA+ superfamily ATPase